MQREAESHAEEDRKAKEAIEIKNNADMLAYQSEKQLKELGDKFEAEENRRFGAHGFEAVVETVASTFPIRGADDANPARLNDESMPSPRALRLREVADDRHRTVQ